MLNANNIFHLDTDKAKDMVLGLFNDQSDFCFSAHQVQDDKSILVGNQISSLECLELIRNKKVSHIMQNSVQPLEAKLQTLKKIKVVKESFFDPGFHILAAEFIQIRFNHATKRESIIEDAFNKLNLEINSTKHQAFYQVVLELVMNAQIDAPKLAHSENYVANQKDSILIVEKKNEHGLLAASVIDFYGTLDCYKMIENIYAAHSSGFRSAMSKNSIGAGLGSALVYEHSDSLYLGVVPKQVSRVSVVLPFNIAEKKIALMQKSFHIIKGF